MELQPVPRPRSPRLAGPAVALFALLAAVAVALLLALAMGLHLRVAGSDPGGSAERGTVLITRDASSADLAVGDEIAFVPPPPYDDAGEISRRVASVSGGALTTESSIDRSRDPWTMATVDPDIKVVVAQVPWLGLLWLAGWPVILGFVVLIALLGLCTLRSRQLTRAPQQPARESILVKP